MSEGFDIAVKIDPGQTLPTIAKVEASLAAAEKEAKLLKDALSTMGRQVSAGMGQMAQAIEMESRMLERATGKSKDFGFQLAALQKLHNDGRISAEQYVTTLQKMGVEFEHTAAQAAKLQAQMAKQAAQTIGLPNAPQSGLSAMTSDPAAMAGAAGVVGAGVAALDHAIHAYHEMDDRVVELTNHGQKFAEQFGSASGAIEAQREAAALLHTTLGQTINVFDAVGDATESLNLTTAEQIKLTENLGMNAKISGNSLDSVSVTLNNLAVAFETGGNAGAAVTKLFKQQHDLGNDLAETLHMTKAEIVEAVKAGTLGFDQLVRAMAAGGGKTRETFGKLQQTYAEWQAQAKESYEIARVSGDDFFGSLKAGIDQANGDLEKSTLTFGQWAFDVSKHLDDIRAKMDTQPKELGFDDVYRLNKAAEEMRQFETDLEGFTTAAYTWNRGVLTAFNDETDATRALRKELAAAAADLAAFNEELNRGNQARNLTQSFRGDNSFNIDRGDSVTGGALQSSPGSAPDSFFSNLGGSGPDAKLSGDEITIPDGDKIHQANDEIAIAAEEAAARTREAWATGLGEVSAHFIKMALDGKKSFGEMTEQILMDLAKIALQQAAMQMGGPYGAFASALIGGFAHGGSHYVKNSNEWLTMPHAAQGNSWQMGGGGGVDDHLFMARVSTGESIEVRTQRQQLAEAQYMSRADKAMAGGGGSGRVTLNVIQQNDPREMTAALGTYEGQRAQYRSRRQFDRRRSG